MLSSVTACKTIDIFPSVFPAQPEPSAARLAALIAEHGDLDNAIAAIQASGIRDDLLVSRLKKRKLQLKDEIAHSGSETGLDAAVRRAEIRLVLRASRRAGWRAHQRSAARNFRSFLSLNSRFIAPLRVRCFSA